MLDEKDNLEEIRDELRQDFLKDMREDVKKEILDPKYAGRKHCAATYSAGCRGPLCRKAERDKKKRRYRQNVNPFPLSRTISIEAKGEEWYLELIQRWHKSYLIRERYLQQSA